MTTDLKAYLITNDDEEYSANLVFAWNEEQAGSLYEAGTDMSADVIVRKPEVDALASKNRPYIETKEKTCRAAGMNFDSDPWCNECGEYFSPEEFGTSCKCEYPNCDACGCEECGKSGGSSPLKDAMDFAREGRPSAHIGALDGGDTRAVALLLCVPSGPTVTGEDMRMYRELKAKFLQMLTNFEDAVQLNEEAAHAS